MSTTSFIVLLKHFRHHYLLHSLLSQMAQMLQMFPLDVSGNLDYKNLCYVITHGEEKEQE